MLAPESNQAARCTLPPARVRLSVSSVPGLARKRGKFPVGALRYCGDSGAVTCTMHARTRLAGSPCPNTTRDGEPAMALAEEMGNNSQAERNGVWHENNNSMPGPLR